jgi:hypothetical protein
MRRGSWKHKGVSAFEDSMLDDNISNSAVD